MTTTPRISHREQHQNHHAQHHHQQQHIDNKRAKNLKQFLFSKVYEATDSSTQLNTNIQNRSALNSYTHLPFLKYICLLLYYTWAIAPSTYLLTAQSNLALNLTPTFVRQLLHKPGYLHPSLPPPKTSIPTHALCPLPLQCLPRSLGLPSHPAPTRLPQTLASSTIALPHLGLTLTIMPQAWSPWSPLTNSKFAQPTTHLPSNLVQHKAQTSNSQFAHHIEICHAKLTLNSTLYTCTLARSFMINT
jgi:hypothetical protein